MCIFLGCSLQRDVDALCIDTLCSVPLHPLNRPQVDITLNNDLAVANTALLRDYAAIDGRLRQLLLLIKHWAKRRRVNDAYTGARYSPLDTAAA